MSNITTDFITTTKKIVAEVRSVLTTLHLIREDVRVIRDKVVSDNNKQSSDRQENQTDKQQANEALGGSKLLDVNQANGEAKNTEHKEANYFTELKNSIEKSVRTTKFFFELAALTVVIVYTCETCRTNNLTEAALDANAKQFRLQQRPYVWPIPRHSFHVKSIGIPSGAPPSQGFQELNDQWLAKEPVDKEHFRIAIDVDIKNSGHSPAVNLLVTPSTVIAGTLDDAKERALKYVPDYPTNTTGAIIIADQTVTVKTGERPVIDLKENDFIANGTWVVFIVGGVKYQDTMSPRIPPYETVYCFAYNPTGIPYGSCRFRETTMR